MGGVRKPLFVCLLAALLALGIAACGDSGGDDSTGGSGAATTQETSGSEAAEGSESGDGESDEASAAFLTPGGDNSVQTYGEEADASEVEEATAALSGFFEARADADWAAQCEYLAEAAVKPLEQLATRTKQLRGKDCAALLEALSGGIPAPERANTLTDGIASLRFEGEQGFALYHGLKGSDYFIPMVKEDGEWKVGSLTPTEFP